MRFLKVGRGARLQRYAQRCGQVPAEPSEHMRFLKYTRMDPFHSGLNRGYTMLRLTRDGSPYPAEASVYPEPRTLPP